MTRSFASLIASLIVVLGLTGCAGVGGGSADNDRIVNAIVADDVYTVRGAVQNGGLNPNARVPAEAYPDGAPIIAIASRAAALEVMRFLISSGADVNARTPVNETRIYPDLPAVLDALVANHRLAVLSNKPHELTMEVCKALLGRWPFAVIEGQRPDRPRKPDPRALRHVSDQLGVELVACALVGDSEVDIATARGAGATSIGVSWGLRPLAVLTEAAPDHLRGRYLSLFQLSWAVGGVLAPAAYTFLLDHGRDTLWLVLLGVAVVAGGYATRLWRVVPSAALAVVDRAR